MTLFILTETSAGYALLKAKDKKLLKRDDIATEAATPEGVSNLYVHVLFICLYGVVFGVYAVASGIDPWNVNYGEKKKI
jgi:NOP5NT (NUC127) domain